MTWYRAGFLGAALLVLAAFALPLGNAAAAGLASRPGLLAATLAVAVLFAAAPWRQPACIPLGLVGVVLGCAVTLALLGDPDIAGWAASGFWALTLGTWLAAALVVTRLAALRPRSEALQRANDVAVPLLFGAFVFYLWEVAVRGFGVPSVLMPAPSAMAVRFASSLPVLGEDFVQTFVRGVLSGYAIGCGAGFLVAIVAHRYAFLGKGLLPLGNFVSALPIVGIAPIMVMWFGFDWPSKTAVVAVITFFPMLVDTLAGLAAAGAIERDLMRSYGARPAQTLLKLHLPAAMPFIFNALKIDMVWAEIALSAIAGMAFYGIVALAERATTFWHPSYRT
jgi:NitT/TauT family transport system permease protein